MAEAQFVRALALHQEGRLDDARALYDEVLKAAPGHGGALHMLGVMALQAGDADRAAELLARAAVGDPDVPALHSNLGLALLEKGEPLRAAQSFARALALQPGLAAAHAGLGDALAAVGRAAEAEASYARAVAQDPGHAEALASLAMLAFARGDGAAALAFGRAALEAEENPRTRRVFSEIAGQMRWTGDDPAVRALLARAIAGGWGRAGKLGGAVADLVRHRLRAGGALEDDALLLAFLPAAPNCDIELERLLAGARRELLAKALAGEAADIDFAAALAQQCFINEYVFAGAPEEAQQALALKAKLEAAIDTAPPLWIAVAAAYFPLGAVAGSGRLAQRALPEAVLALLNQQIAEPAEEARLAAALPRITPIGAGVSQKVQGQYEENPYPRWVKPAAADDVISLAAFLRGRFPAYRPQACHAAPRMLSAGCGTGQYVLELARRLRPGSIAALDLSRASLGYAARKAAELGVDIAFAQGDLLALNPQAMQFDFIEASGVLHHLANPFAGWRRLAGCLAPGGVMLVALYSRAARAKVAGARALIAREGFAATPDGIRACRARLMAQGADELGIIAAADFFTTSACRDLLFHVEEHGMDLDEIAAFLVQNQFTFLGFETGEDVLARYRARFPGDAGARDLANWAALEREQPALFSAMYQFWVQKPA